MKLLQSVYCACILPVLLLAAGLISADEADTTRYETAIFAGGCFWCMEPPFDAIDGVISTTSGYTGGHKANPSYQEVSHGGTGHTEAVRIVYDPVRVSYSELLEVFWHNIDPTNAQGQFCDFGNQYRSEIFYSTPQQQQQAMRSRNELEVSQQIREPIVTRISPVTEFYPAEDYHQDYYRKNPLRYKFYRYGCGRDKRLEELWGNSG
jgi:peptide-methionine (S)-S-oxide reductase